jgi:glycyl-tRNA synthetase, dimeric type
MERQSLESLVNLCARRSIIIPAFEAYGEVSGFYDYGPIGTRIKHNIENSWRKSFVDSMGNLEIESTVVCPERVFEASGHLKNFVDPVVNCPKCGSSYRADKLLEEYFAGLKDDARREAVKHSAPAELQSLIKENIKCLKCKSDLGEVGTFNLMFQTKIGPSNKQVGYLRPETAQGIFLDFKSIFRNYGLKLPIGIGQIGKVFRNEISPRNMLIRMREFSQMEMEYFFDPADLSSIEKDAQTYSACKINFLSRDAQANRGSDTEPVSIGELLDRKVLPNHLYAMLLARELDFLKRIGITDDLIRFRDLMEDELPHYSKRNVDVEVKMQGGFEEVIGNAYRTDFDLTNHQNASGKNMSIMSNNKNIVPHVVETSFGIDRLFWAAMYNSLYKTEGREWDVLLLNESIAPYRYALFPLQKDEQLINKTIAVRDKLSKSNLSVFYSESGSIGKRYAKADEMGIPYSVTIDYDTLKDETVTVRNASDTKQTRVDWNHIR